MSTNKHELVISVPSNGFLEIEYMLRVYLSEFLGISYDINQENTDSDTVLSIGDSSLTIRNAFWRQATPEYSIEDIPTKVDKSTLTIGKKDYPSICLYGKNVLTTEEKTWTLENDILANGFFMLSRWEEHINKKRDQHMRFPGSAALAVRQRFLNRPIVNEYTEILWGILHEMGIQQSRKERSFEIVPTHDVDMPYYFKNTAHYLKKTVWQLSKLNFKQAKADTTIFLTGEGPYDYHDKQMDDAEKIGTKAHFFFMTAEKTKYDPGFNIESKKTRELLAKIKGRGHHIGLHPSYDTYNNPELFTEEKHRLEKVIGSKVTTGRQHYLRFATPETWRIWENNNMEWDSTLAYADRAGFRCGVCYEFPVYDFIDRKELKLREKPLIMMEVSLKQYENLSADQAIKRIDTLRTTVEKYNGSFVYLWHNSSYEKDGWEEYNSVYERTLNSKFDSL